MAAIKKVTKGVLHNGRGNPSLKGHAQRLFSNAGMAVWKFFAFAGFRGRLLVLITREAVSPPEPFKLGF